MAIFIHLSMNISQVEGPREQINLTIVLLVQTQIFKQKEIYKQ